MNHYLCAQLLLQHPLPPPIWVFGRTLRSTKKWLFFCQDQAHISTICLCSEDIQTQIHQFSRVTYGSWLSQYCSLSLSGQGHLWGRHGSGSWGQVQMGWQAFSGGHLDIQCWVITAFLIARPNVHAFTVLTIVLLLICAIVQPLPSFAPPQPSLNIAKILSTLLVDDYLNYYQVLALLIIS